MIVSNLYREPHEGKDHFDLKKKVGRLADIYYMNMTKGKYDVAIWYEYNFDVLATSLGPRYYIGDIVIFFSDPLNQAKVDEGVKMVINIEIDGFEGHSSTTERKKNRVRDEALRRGMMIGKKQFPILTKRILVGKYSDDDILLELHDVYIKTLKLYNS